MKKQGHVYRDNKPLKRTRSTSADLMDEIQQLILKKDQHPISPGEIDALDAAWRKRWPTVPPGAHGTRIKMPEPRARFHSLPGSEGRVDTYGELAELTSRHLALLADLNSLSERDRDNLFLIVEDWSAKEVGGADRGLHVNYAEAPRGRKYPKGGLGLKFPRGSLWMSTLNPDPNGKWDHWLSYYVLRVGLNSDILRVYFELLGRDLIYGWAICPPDVEWIYSSYEVGMTVFAATEADRDLLRSRYPAWLPIGLAAKQILRNTSNG